MMVLTASKPIGRSQPTSLKRDSRRCKSWQTCKITLDSCLPKILNLNLLWGHHKKEKWHERVISLTQNVSNSCQVSYFFTK